MAELEQTHEISLNWHSFELRPKDGPPISPEYRARIEASRPQLYETARQQYGVELNVGPFGVDSRPALIGAKVAEAAGHGPAYHDAVLRGYWQEAKNIEDVDVLTALAEAAGMDGDAFRAGLTDPEYAAEVDEDVELARVYGLQGVPAMVFAEKYLVPGAVPTATLRQIVEQVRDEVEK